MADSIKRAKDAFGADNCIVLSNSAGSGDDAPEYNAAKACEAALGLRVARHPDAQKPQCFAGVVASLPASDASTVAVVGDRLSTDISRRERNRGAQRAHAAARYEGRQPRRLVIALPREPAAPAFVKAPRRGASYPPGRRGPRAHAAGDGPAAFFAVMRLRTFVCFLKPKMDSREDPARTELREIV